MKHLSVKNLTAYQHYTKRNPPWVKLHRTSLNDYDLRLMPPVSRLCFHYCTILASETENFIPYDLSYLSARMGFEVTELVLSPLLIKKCLLASGGRRIISSVAPSSVSVSVSDSSSESEGEKIVKKRGEDFDVFYDAYPATCPRKVRKTARSAWDKASLPLLDVILAALEAQKLSSQWQKDGGQFIPSPSRWLNEERWANVVVAAAHVETPEERKARRTWEFENPIQPWGDRNPIPPDRR